MRNFLDSVIALTLVFIMLVMGPITISAGIREVRTERMVMREVQQFLDRVIDSKEIRQVDLDNLYLAINSHGGEYDVDVVRQVRAVYLNTKTEEVQEIYFGNGTLEKIDKENPEVLNVGDVVKVDLKTVERGRGQKILWGVSKIDKGKLDFSIRQMVR